MSWREDTCFIGARDAARANGWTYHRSLDGWRSHVMEMVLFIGIPGAGKSSYYLQRFYATHIRLSLDLLKTRHRERAFIDTCLKTQQPFVVDNTNVTKAERAVYIQKAKAFGFRVRGFFFYSTLADALRRNDERTGRGKIPRVGVVVKFKRLEPPEMSEGFDELWTVTLNKTSGFLVEPWAPVADAGVPPP